MKKNSILCLLRNERGISAIIVGVFILFVGIGIAAFAIDFGYRHVAQNELQNAADAGALAGARALYYGDGTKVNDDGVDPTGQWTLSANQIAHDAAVANNSAGTAVEVYNYLPNSGADDEDVQRGHWSFGIGTLPRGFYCTNGNLSYEDNYSDTTPAILGGHSEVELDGNIHNINAVKVITRRQSTPVSTFFGKIFGRQSFTLRAESVAYVGFAGTLEPEKVDQPIAICARSLFNDANNNGKLDQDETMTCNIGRMADSGNGIEKFNTAGWTDFNQEGNPCHGGTNNKLVRSLVCAEGNPKTITFGKNMATNGGTISDVMKNYIIPCWEAETDKNKPWSMVLPVINCQDPNVGTCEEAIGAVTINVIWIIDQQDNKCGKELPEEMSGVPMGGGNYFPDWTRARAVAELGGTPTDCEIWEHFADNFQLKNLVAENGDLIFGTAPYARHSMYFAPNCDIHQSGGTTGGVNFGVRADIPVIVNTPFVDKLDY
jgi:hypothetical protein